MSIASPDDRSPSPQQGAGRRRAEVSPSQVEIELTQSFQGPIPHPAFLEAYERIVPGSAKDIIDTFKVEVIHRRDLELREDARVSRGQTMGFLIALLFLAGAIALGLMGYPTQGVVLGTVDIVALVAVFLTGSRD